MIELTKFSNGLTVVTDNRTSVRSASVGFWIGAGSAFESADDNGISHFTEHVMFKGTEKYSAREIAENLRTTELISMLLLQKRQRAIISNVSMKTPKIVSACFRIFFTNRFSATRNSIKSERL